MNLDDKEQIDYLAARIEAERRASEPGIVRTTGGVLAALLFWALAIPILTCVALALTVVIFRDR
jgi:hypothetical protein